MSLINYDQGRIAQSENGPTSLTVALGGTMNLSQLNYFKKLAEVLHYTRAAQELFITQPTLSGAISSLEKELGAPLFERNGRSVLLTPYGEVFYEHVCLALRAIDDGVAAVSARSSASFGTVNLGTTFTTQDHYLPSLIRDFEEAFDKRVIVKVSQGFTNYLTEQLHRGTLDVAFCGKRDNEPDIAYFPVKHCELALYVRDDHPLASADTITFAELNEVDLHTYRRGTPIGERVAKMLEEADVRGVSLGLRRRCVHGVVSLLQRRQRRSAYAGLAGRPAVQQPAPGARRGHPGALLHGVYGLPQEARALPGRGRLHRLREGLSGQRPHRPGAAGSAGRVGAPGPIGRDGRAADVWVSGRSTAQPVRSSRLSDCRLWSFCAVCGHLLREAGKARPVVV